MSVEAATYINQLDATKPASGDPKSEGDDHLRLLKSAVKATFPNLTATPVTPTSADLNTVAGASTTGAVGFNVQTQASTDNTTKAASTAMVQSAILASSGITASLPAQSGNTGKFLTTNGTTPSWAAPGNANIVFRQYPYASPTGTWSRGPTIAGTYSQSGTTITATVTAHGRTNGDYVYLSFTSGTAVSGWFAVTVTGANTFTVTAGGSLTTSGNVTYYPPIVVSITSQSTHGLSDGATVISDGGSPTVFGASVTARQITANTFQVGSGTGTSGANSSGTVTFYSIPVLSTWTKPSASNFWAADVFVIGGGGAGTGGNAGTAGGASRKIFMASELSASHTVTAGVAGGVFNAQTVSAGTSSFGALLSATGGGASPGMGTGGSLNYRGGLPVYAGGNGAGGASVLGGNTVYGAAAGSVYGAGGGGDGASASGNGAGGVVYVWEIYQ